MLRYFLYCFCLVFIAKEKALFLFIQFISSASSSFDAFLCAMDFLCPAEESSGPIIIREVEIPGDICTNIIALLSVSQFKQLLHRSSLLWFFPFALTDSASMYGYIYIATIFMCVTCVYVLVYACTWICRCVGMHICSMYMYMYTLGFFMYVCM